MTAAPPPAAVATAIAWMVRLQSGQATPQDHQACQHWQRERPEHAQAWAAIHGFSQQLRTLPSALAHGTLAERPRPGRRAVLKGVLLLGGGAGVGFAAAPDGGWQAMAAEHRTGVGERRRVALADGSALHLNTATSLDTRFNEGQRCVTLHAGEVLVDCAPAPRPLLVRTADGEVRASEGRFLVRQFEGRTDVQALTASLDVQPRGAAGLHLGPGQQSAFDADGAHAAAPVDGSAAAWIDGLLVARDMRLAELAAELARYRRGWLRCEQAVAALRISGVFPIDDLDRVVAALQRTLPVRARALTRWWVSLGPR